MPEISIIVPIYNASATLSRCVNSLVEQTFSDIEIILVDDGSTDLSGVICDNFAQQDARIKVFHLPNSGVSHARQAGVDAATGEYVIHADADDWAEKDMLEILLKKALKTDADMVTCDYILELPKGPKHIYLPSLRQTTSGLIHQYLSGEIQCMLWNKLIRRTCYKDVKFPNSINYCEDMFVLINMLFTGKIENVEYINRAFYHYNKKNSSSITSKPDLRILTGQIFITDYFSKLLPQQEYAHELFQLKRAAKQIALDWGGLNRKQFKVLYPEIHSRLKIDWQVRSFVSSLSLYVATRGCYRFGIWLIHLWDKIELIIASRRI